MIQGPFKDIYMEIIHMRYMKKTEIKNYVQLMFYIRIKDLIKIIFKFEETLFMQE